MSCPLSGCGATPGSSEFGTAPARSSGTSSRASCCDLLGRDMSDGPVRVTRSGAVLEVVIDRPKANAIDAASSRAMGEVFAGFRDDAELRVAIITGAGDMIIAAEHARFALPEISAGTLADAATIKLPRRIPYHVAMDMLLTGRWMEADEALRWGLINRVVPASELMNRAARLP